MPGVNGLGKTAGTKSSPDLIVSNLNIKKSYIKEILLDNSNLVEQEKEIFNEMLSNIKKPGKLMVIGGDHSISYPIGKAFLQSKMKNPALIIFDAHPDCMPPMENPTHEEWLRALIKHKFPADNILLIGTRKIEPEEKLYLEKNQIKIVSIDEIKKDTNRIIQKIKEFSENKTVYISFDIDVLCHSIAPATSYPENKGINLKEAIEIFKALKKINWKIFDIVEINAEKPGLKETIKTVLILLKIII